VFSCVLMRPHVFSCVLMRSHVFSSQSRVQFRTHRCERARVMPCALCLDHHSLPSHHITHSMQMRATTTTSSRSTATAGSCTT
jgi:hypothetical protein